MKSKLLQVTLLTIFAVFFLSSQAHANFDKKNDKNEYSDSKKENRHHDNNKKDDRKDDGEWHVKTDDSFGHHGDYPFCKIKDGKDCNPVVTPEPVSSTLFLLGGLPMAARLLRKKETSA